MLNTPKKLIVGISLGFLLAACASMQSASSSSPDSKYVKVSDTTGYYLLTSTSPMREKLGLGGAPVVPTGGQIHNGRGRDVIAFRFNEHGVLASAPAYIYQSQPDGYYTERLKALSVGRSNFGDIKTLFPNSVITRENGGSLVYLSFRVRNVSERMP